MKKTTKLIAMLTVMTLLTGLLTIAFADDRIYTSPTFKIPKDRVVVLPDPEPEQQPEEQPAEEPASVEPAAEEPASEEPAAEKPAAEEPASEEPAAEEPASEEPAAEEPAYEESAEEPAYEEPAEEPAYEEPAEEPAYEEPAEEPAYEEPAEEPASEEPAPETPVKENKPAAEPAPVERKVRISSSRKDTVIRDQFITLYSELVGFDGLEPHYQWQVDRGDGNGWVDVEGATGATHSFVARPDTILYNWRLIVTVDE